MKPRRRPISLVTGDAHICTFRRASGEWRADYRVQVATYAMLAPGASGRTRLQTLTKTKTVQLNTQTIDVTAADRTHATKLYQIAQEGMRSGLYVPNRSSFLCSRRYCSFWGQCVAEYGGVVSRRRESAVLCEEMRVDPSEPPCRRRLQTARSCFSQKLWW
jgi:hypothetical protein